MPCSKEHQLGCKGRATEELPAAEDSSEPSDDDGSPISDSLVQKGLL